MIVQSVQCDNCGKIMKNESEDYFLITGGIYKGTRYSLVAPLENTHVCVNCFIKHFNLMVSTKTDSMVIGAVAELTKLTDSDSYQICAGKTCVTIPSKDNPYPIR